jgi:small subunit ribosomal protein S6
MKLNPSKIAEIEKAFKINTNLLKYQFVKIEEK